MFAMMIWIFLFPNTVQADTDGSSHTAVPVELRDRAIKPAHDTDYLKANIPLECWVITNITDPPTLGMLGSFTTDGANECWLYCKFMRKCVILTFDTMDGNCTLYNYDISQQGSGERVILTFMEALPRS